jgi:hypothetical protein
MRTRETVPLGQDFLGPTEPISIRAGTPPHGFFRPSKPAGAVSFDSPETETAFFRRYPSSNVKVIRGLEDLGELPSLGDVILFLMSVGLTLMWLYVGWRVIKVDPRRFWKLQRRFEQMR